RSGWLRFGASRSSFYADSGRVCEIANTFTSEDQQFISRTRVLGLGSRSGTGIRGCTPSITGQLVENSDQLSFRGEIDFDSPPLALADDSDFGSEQELESILGGARVDVDRRLRRLFGRFSAFRFDGLPHERFGLTHGQASGDDVARYTTLVAFLGER